jgi:tetratricopeptide (TPR) repeat protein
VFNPFPKLFGSNRAATRDIGGNVIVGDVSGIVIQAIVNGQPAAPLSLPWRELAGGRDRLGIFNLFTWRSRLSPTLIGRENDSKQLLAWARDDQRPMAIRFLSGPGGAGKSRLAAETADVLREDGWSTGMISLDQTTTLPVSKGGLFVAIDYPEANRESVRALLRAAARLENPPCKIRLLLISRQHADWWHEDLIATRASELCDGQETSVGPLPPELVCKLVREISSRLAKHLGTHPPAPDDAAVHDWLDRDPALHSLPLFTTAAAVHAVLDRAPTFTLAGTEIIGALVARERMRLDMAAEEAGWPEARAASRLHGLAALRTGLDERALKHLARTAPDIGLPPPERIIDKVEALGWWTDSKVLAPQPDLVAAELLHQVLKEHPQTAPDWLAAALADQDAIEVERLGRLLHDIVTLHGESPKSITTWLVEAVRRNPKLAVSWEPFLYSEAVPFRLVPLAVAIGRVLLQVPDLKDDRRAAILANLSNRLSDGKDHAAALAASQEAVEIRRRLAEATPARFQPDLAGSYNNLSNCLSDAGDHAAALAAIQEAVEIRRRLAEANPARFQPDLAGSYNNLSIILSNVGDHAAALAASQEAAEIRRRLAQANPVRFEPDLARSLNNLSNRLSDAGDHAAALTAIQEAVDIDRRLAKANPARFETELAICLNNLSHRLNEAGDHAAALAARQEAEEITRCSAAPPRSR